MAKTLFIDIRNVLLFFDFNKMNQQIANYCKVSVQEVEESLKQEHWADLYEKGEIDSIALFHKLPEKIRGMHGFTRWMEAISNIFSSNDPIVPYLKKLKQEKISLFTLSNICEAHFDYAYTHFSILHFFDGHILSYELNKRLPDIEMYEIALNKSGAKKEECFYISSSQTYVDKAQSLSIGSTLYQDVGSLAFQLQQKRYLP